MAVASGGLLIEQGASGEPAVWPYTETKLVRGGPLRFERSSEMLIVTDESLLGAITQLNPEVVRLMEGGLLYGMALQGLGWAVAAVAIVFAAVAFTWFVLIPWTGSAIATAVPVSWEERLGQAVTQGFTHGPGKCSSAALQNAMEDIVRQLNRAAPSSPYQFRVTLSNDEMVNAFAAPGGHVVVCRGLIERAETAEEVAGVIAHELVHVRQRHATRALFRDMTIAVSLGLLLGDMGTLANLGSALGSLQFRRADEEEADREGFSNLVAARIDPAGMLTFFRKLEAEGPEMPLGAKYLSTHPATRDRINEIDRRIREAGAAGGKWLPPLPGQNWPELRRSCR